MTASMKGKKPQRRFECTGCGGCCSGSGEHYIEATRAEQQRIRRYLGISWRWFRRRYVTRYADGTEGLYWNRDRCVFLDAGRRCRIYLVRPGQCRDYPFWPELATDAAWREEARRCEGIGRGAVIPLNEFKAQLRRATARR
jgi:uncharacterized protein